MTSSFWQPHRQFAKATCLAHFRMNFGSEQNFSQAMAYQRVYVTLKNNWVRRFYIRWEISLRRKSNTKCSTVFERYSQINNYDKWLIYHFQEPWNFDTSYFDHGVFVEKVNMTIEADEDPDETKFELEEESEISSDSFWMFFSIHQPKQFHFCVNFS